jgi:inosose dehydratase
VTPLREPPRPLRAATAPVNWNNADAPQIRPHVPARQMLREMRAAGYDATEFGPGLPDDPAALRDLLDEAGMRLVGGFFALPLSRADAGARFAADVERFAALLRGAGADLVVLCDAIQEERGAWAGRILDPSAPRLTEEGRIVLAQNAAAVAERLRDLGMRTAYHPHVATYVEAPDEVRSLLDGTDPSLLGLCLDTGHLAYGGGDPVAAARAYGDRVWHVHLKDVDRVRLERARREGWSFVQALERRIFSELGRGGVDLPGVRDALRASGYAGWVVVEQDTQEGSALEAATRNRRYVKDVFGA